ncbi:MAG: hypothetical protein U9Q74_14985, partial [Gemmatimonadota bacterium]|nr:hypothetical protein [Gemmatimonadota bacterium]
MPEAGLTLIKVLVVSAAIVMAVAVIFPVFAGCGRQADEARGDQIAQAPDDPMETETADRSGAIIIDHTCLKLSRIPDRWIEEARANLRVHYA